MSAKRRKANIDDGFNPELVFDADFEGLLEIPCTLRQGCPKELIPTGMIPFSRRKSPHRSTDFICFYEMDPTFACILEDPAKFNDDFESYGGLIGLDCSLYRDSPLEAQIASVYRSRAISYYYQKQGRIVVPNVRWGDERSYTNEYFPEKFAFLGIPKHYIVSIGTYGCIQGAENRKHFKNGLTAMLETLSPQIVLVYGSMPDSIFGGLKGEAEFIQFPDWISLKKGGRHGNR